ncbi:MAG: ChaN family lipoprotein [Aliishimia sp.]
MRYLIALLISLSAACVSAQTPQEWAQKRANVFILGEVHDNPTHHARQADFLRDLAPKAVIYEMLHPAEAASLSTVPRESDAVKAAVTGMEWANLSDYADVLVASEVIVGAALPRDQVRAAFSTDAATVFGGQAKQYGLNADLSDDEVTLRKELQFSAHCEAMPLEMMGGMVEAQRLRDAVFARATLEALDTYGSPVVLITGNGHARRDWGVPRHIAQAAPDVVVLTFGQSEGGANLSGGFDAIWDASAVERPDPCAAFQ